MAEAVDKKNRIRKTAEVFTPIPIVNDLLGRLPSDAWHSSKTFCDPACGDGNFLVEILKRKIKLGHDPTESLKRIYGTDIMEDNIERCRERLLRVLKEYVDITSDHVKTVSKNIVFLNKKTYPNGSLDYDFSFHDESEFYFFEEGGSFDVITMNPPYQKEQKNGVTGGTVFLWKRFMELALKITNEDGYILSINPSSWRQPGEALYKIISSYDMLFLRVVSIKEVRKIFDVFMLLDFYIIKKSNSRNDFLMIDIDGNECRSSLSLLPFLPNGSLDGVCNIVAKDGEEKCPSYYDGTFHDQKTHILSKKYDPPFVFPCVYSMKKKGLVKYLYSRVKPNTVPKVICSLGGHPYPINDYEGNLGLTNKTFGIRISSKDEGDKIVKALNSEKFQEIIKATKWCTYHVNYKVFSYYRRDFWKDFI